MQIKAEHRAAHSQPELTTPIGSLSAGDTLSNIVACHLEVWSVTLARHSLSERRKRNGGAGGGSRTHTGLTALRIFMPSAAFAALAGAPSAQRRVCGLDYPFTVPRKIRGLGAARLVSTPSRLECSGRAWLGIAISGFPEFGQFCIAGFPGEHSSFLKSVASAIPPRPRGWSSGAIYHMGQRDVTSVWR